MNLSYPIGKFTFPESCSPEQRAVWIEEIRAAPAHLKTAVSGLSPSQLDTPYRPGGWTVRQVVHHLPDSHINAFVRFKLGLTEDFPTIRPYDDQLWAMLPDVQATPVEVSLALLEALHERWVYLLLNTSAEAFLRKIRHPALGEIRLDQLLAMYAWHGRHHVAHVRLVTGLE